MYNRLFTVPACNVFSLNSKGKNCACAICRGYTVFPLNTRNDFQNSVIFTQTNKTPQNEKKIPPREGKYCVGSDTKISLLGRGNFVWDTQNLSSINHGGEILCAFICVFYTKSPLPREGKFCVPKVVFFLSHVNHCWEVRVMHTQNFLSMVYGGEILCPPHKTSPP